MVVSVKNKTVVEIFDEVKAQIYFNLKDVDANNNIGIRVVAVADNYMYVTTTDITREYVDHTIFSAYEDAQEKWEAEGKEIITNLLIGWRKDNTISISKDLLSGVYYSMIGASKRIRMLNKQDSSWDDTDLQTLEKYAYILQEYLVGKRK